MNRTRMVPAQAAVLPDAPFVALVKHARTRR